MLNIYEISNFFNSLHKLNCLEIQFTIKSFYDYCDNSFELHFLTHKLFYKLQN